MIDKHFEHIWEEAEKIAPSNQIEIIFESISKDLESLKQDKSSDSFGRVLFNLCTLSKILNVNTWAALTQEIENQKIDLLDPEE